MDSRSAGSRITLDIFFPLLWKCPEFRLQDRRLKLERMRDELLPFYPSSRESLKKMFSILQKGENKTRQAFTFLYWHLFSYDFNCPSLLLFLHYSCFSHPYHAFSPENVDTWKNGLSRMKRKWEAKSRHILRRKFIHELYENYLCLHGVNYLTTVYRHPTKELLFKSHNVLQVRKLL